MMQDALVNVSKSRPTLSFEHSSPLSAVYTHTFSQKSSWKLIRKRWAEAEHAMLGCLPWLLTSLNIAPHEATLYAGI